MKLSIVYEVPMGSSLTPALRCLVRALAVHALVLEEASCWARAVLSSEESQEVGACIHACSVQACKRACSCAYMRSTARATCALCTRRVFVGLAAHTSAYQCGK